MREECERTGGCKEREENVKAGINGGSSAVAMPWEGVLRNRH